MALAHIAAFGCNACGDIDIMTLKNKARSVIESNGITAPAFVFAIGDSLDGFFICKETKRHLISYVVKEIGNEEKIAIKIVKKSERWAKAMLRLCRYNKDFAETSYIADDYKVNPNTETGLAPTIVYLYYNKDKVFTGTCVDCRLNKSIYKSETDETIRSLAALAAYITLDDNLKAKNDKSIIKLLKKVEKAEK